MNTYHTVLWDFNFVSSCHQTIIYVQFILNMLDHGFELPKMGLNPWSKIILNKKNEWLRQGSLTLHFYPPKKKNHSKTLSIKENLDCENIIDFSWSDCQVVQWSKKYPINFHCDFFCLARIHLRNLQNTYHT